MVELKVRLGSKGQVVIPKIFRNLFKMHPGNEIIITIEKDKGVLIRKTEGNAANRFKELAERELKKVPDQKKIKKIVDEQYEDKYASWIKN